MTQAGALQVERHASERAVAKQTKHVQRRRAKVCIHNSARTNKYRARVRMSVTCSRMSEFQSDRANELFSISVFLNAKQLAQSKILRKHQHTCAHARSLVQHEYVLAQRTHDEDRLQFEARQRRCP
jgi:hypothetical protein